MKVTVKESVTEMLQRFLVYLQSRINDPLHAANGSCIADFIEKFVIVEMRQGGAPFDHTVEVPDEVYKKPLEVAQKQVEVYKGFLEKVLSAQENIATTAREFLKKGIPQEIPTLESVTKKSEALDKLLTPTAEVTPPSTTPEVTPSTTTIPKQPRNGNGHKSLKVRNLDGSEKDIIRAAFKDLNGQITEDACKPIHERLNPEISIAQVTGFVTYLHAKVAEGAMQLKDLNAYIAFIQSHRDLWATYDSPKYRAMRSRSSK